MNTRHNLFRAGFALLLLSVLAAGAYAQTGRVSAYTVTSTNLGFTTIAGQAGTVTLTTLSTGYAGQHVSEPLTFSMPFAFNYDATAIASGTTLYLSSGRLQFGNAPASLYAVSQGGLGNSTYPGMLLPLAEYYWSMGGGYPSHTSYPAGIYTQVSGTSPNQVFTIEMQGCHSPVGGYNWLSDGYGPTAVQIKLFQSSNNIEFIYSAHNEECNPEGTGYPGGLGVGLNGFTSPSFVSMSITNSTTNSPSTDYILAPPAPPQELSLTPNPKLINFGTTTPSAPITKFVTVSSVGAAGTTITIQGYSLSSNGVPPAYTVISGPAVGTVIPAGTSVQYGITFQPFNNGSITGTFTVTTNGRDSGTQVMNLTGNGAVPLVSYSTNKMFLGTVTEVDSVSPVQWLYVNSIGGGPLVINSVQTIGQDARAYIVTHLPAGAIPAGGVDSIGIKFAPDLEGQPQAQLVINTTAVNIPSDTVNFLGIGILPHLATVSVNAANQESNIGHTLVVNFDSVQLGVDSCLQVTLTNPGSDTTAIMQNFFSSHDFDFTLTPVTGSDTLIPPGGSTNFQVCFSPLQRGFRSATVEIKTNIPHTQTTPQMDTSVFYVKFIGTGVPVGNLLITGPMTSDTTPVGTPLCQEDTFWNIGESPLTLTGITITGTNASVFTGTLPTFPVLIQPNSYWLYQVCGDPSDTGIQIAVLGGTANNGSGKAQTASLNLNVFGTKTGDTVIVATPFPTLTCVGDTAIATVTVTNTGNVPTKFTASLAGANASDFQIVGSPVSPMEQSGGIATYQVKFGPTTGGLETLIFNTVPAGTVTINAQGGAANISGTGTAKLTTVNEIDTFSATVNNTGTCEWTPGVPTISNSVFAYLSGGTTSIPAGQSGTLMFTFTPTAAQTYSNVPVSFPNPTGISIPAANVVLNGTGTDASVTIVSSKGGYVLEQNYPNPFHDESDAEITLPVPGNVQLSIIDIKGETVQLALNQNFNAGTYDVKLDASTLPTGTYYYEMQVNGITLTREMTIVK